MEDYIEATIKYTKNSSGGFDRSLTTKGTDGGRILAMVNDILKREFDAEKEKGRQEIIDNMALAITRFAKGL